MTFILLGPFSNSPGKSSNQSADRGFSLTSNRTRETRRSSWTATSARSRYHDEPESYQQHTRQQQRPLGSLMTKPKRLLRKQYFSHLFSLYVLLLVLLPLYLLFFFYRWLLSLLCFFLSTKWTMIATRTSWRLWSIVFAYERLPGRTDRSAIFWHSALQPNRSLSCCSSDGFFCSLRCHNVEDENLNVTRIRNKDWNEKTTFHWAWHRWRRWYLNIDFAL